MCEPGQETEALDRSAAPLGKEPLHLLIPSPPPPFLLLVLVLLLLLLQSLLSYRVGENHILISNSSSHFVQQCAGGILVDLSHHARNTLPLLLPATSHSTRFHELLVQHSR